MNSNPLLDSHPLVVLPELAVAIGLDEAIVLQQIHYWCRLNARNRRNYRDGNYWTRNSMPQWQEQFPWYKKSKLERTFASLKKKGLIIIGNYNKLPTDRTNWYRVNYDALQMLINAPSPQNEWMEHLELKSPLPETYTKNNGKTEKWIFPLDYPADSPAEKPRAVPIVERSDEGISWFINWYFERYAEHFGEPHPNIKSKQRIRVTKTLAAFIDENDLDEGALQDMAEAFFYNVDCDHNINLFATPGILENRYYESCY